ncbi:MAG: hypothetical protein R6W75_04300, partial [Smithellaceae bacterium]
MAFPAPLFFERKMNSFLTGLSAQTVKIFRIQRPDEGPPDRLHKATKQVQSHFTWPKPLPLATEGRQIEIQLVGVLFEGTAGLYG